MIIILDSCLLLIVLKAQIAHSGAINGTAIDLVNKNVVSGDDKGVLNFWQFNPPKLIARMKLPSGVTMFRLDRLNSLLAVALDNGELGVVDILRRQLARHFKMAHSSDAAVTALEISRDGKWLLSTDNKNYLKVFVFYF